MNSIFHHVSIRKYKNQPVEKEKITGYYGKLTEKQMREVNQAMLIELGII